MTSCLEALHKYLGAWTIVLCPWVLWLEQPGEFWPGASPDEMVSTDEESREMYTESSAKAHLATSRVQEALPNTDSEIQKRLKQRFGKEAFVCQVCARQPAIRQCGMCNRILCADCVALGCLCETG
jgi:hypothetical protein